MRILDAFRIVVALLVVACCQMASAQGLDVRVTTMDKSSIPGVTLQLVRLVSGVKMIGVTDAAGQASFSNVQKGRYRLFASYVGMQPWDTVMDIGSQNRNLHISLKASAFALGEVNILARKPLIRQEDDKTIIDPSPLANSSASTLEVLESAPGIYVDPDGGIFLSTSMAATVYINGREQKMSSQDMANILRGLPPNSVEKIEIIRTPSSKYDASSPGGIVNIILKKGVKIGRFGNVNAGYNQGQGGNAYAGFSLGNGAGGYTRYLNLNIGTNHTLDEINSTRHLPDGRRIMQSAVAHNYNTPLNAGFGISREVSDKLSYGYDAALAASARAPEAENTNLVSAASFQSTQLSAQSNQSHGSGINLEQAFSLNLKLDTAGSNIETKLSHTLSRQYTDQDNTTHILFPYDTSFYGSNDNLQWRNYLMLQSDLTWQLPHSIKLEAGIKGSWQFFDNQSGYTALVNGQEIPNPLLASSFRYKEFIHAAYMQASVKLPVGILLKTGTRLENTFMLGSQKVPSDTSFRVSRTDWFPYVYVSHRVIKIMGAELFAYAIYRKTINRPDYQNLNPAIRVVDPYLYETGNPALNPQFTDNVELNISYQDFPILAVGQNTTRNIFSQVLYPHPLLEKVSVRTYDNLGSNTETYLRGMVGIPPGGKYFFALGAQYNYNKYNGLYNNLPLQYQRGSWRFFTFHSLNLFKETKLTLSGFMMLNGFYNFYELKGFGQLNGSVSQNFLEKKLSVSVFMRDVLNTMKMDFSLQQGTVSTLGERYMDNRRVGVNVRYNFGLKKKEEKRDIPGFEMPEIGN